MSIIGEYYKLLIFYFNGLKNILLSVLTNRSNFKIKLKETDVDSEDKIMVKYSDQIDEIDVFPSHNYTLILGNYNFLNFLYFFLSSNCLSVFFFVLFDYKFNFINYTVIIIIIFLF